MGTTTVRLDADEERMLDRLAAVHGGRSGALKAGLRLLDARDERSDELARLLAEWDAAGGPAPDSEVEALIDRYGLAP